MKKRIVFLGLLITIILGMISYNKYKFISSPTELAEEFLRFLKEDKTRNAYRLILKEDRKQISYENFKTDTQWIISNKWTISNIRIPPIQTVKFRLGKIEHITPGKNCALIYVTKYYYSDEGAKIDFDHFYLFLKKTNYTWKIAFKLTEKYHNVLKDIDSSLSRTCHLSQSIKNLDEQDPNKGNMKLNLKRLEEIKIILQKLISKYGKDDIIIKDFNISEVLMQFEKDIVERKNMIKTIENIPEQIKLIDIIEKHEKLIIPKHPFMSFEGTIIYYLKINRNGKIISRNCDKVNISRYLYSITNRHLDNISFKPLKINGKPQGYILKVTYKFILSNNKNYVITEFKLFDKILK